MDATGLLADEARLEQHLRATEALAAHSDDVAIGELVGLLLVRALSGRLHLGVEVQCDVAQLFFDIAHDLALGRGSERVAALSEDLHQVLCKVTTRQVQAEDGMWQCVALVNWHRVRDAISGVHHNPCGAAGGVQGEHGLDRDVHGGHVERLEHDLRHPLAVGLRVQRRLGQQDGVLLGCDTQLVVEGVVPDLLHVVPIRDNSVLDWIFEREHTALALRLITHIAVLLVHADHDPWHLGTAHNRGEDGARRIIAGETRLAHAAAIVHDQCGNLLLTHCSK
mmetsp:Transcript_22015/g.49320  ORF Transcript_22015/g.49320 Transcript_22015/m.49320 type:complete len:280 (+) Transcript_22015:481-1320(+)